MVLMTYLLTGSVPAKDIFYAWNSPSIVWPASIQLLGITMNYLAHLHLGGQ